MRFRVSVLFLLLLWSRVSPAQSTATVPFIPAPVLPGGVVLSLYPADSPRLNRERIHEAERYNTSLQDQSDKTLNVLNIHNPSIEVHIVGDEPSNTGTAVIVAPGGGHRILWVGPEGADFVPFFKKHGVSTIILRNRLRVDGYEPTTDAVNDAFQAIRLVRAHAAEWKLDPAKIGIMGFSAGAELSAPTALFFDDFERDNNDPADPLAKVSARPDFVGVIYPGPTPFTRDPATHIPRNVPPSFIASAGSGDRVHALWANDYFAAMLKAGVPNLEMQIYGNGGHGGGLSARGGIPFGTWTERYVDWFRDLGFLGKPGVPTKAATDVEAYAVKSVARAADGPEEDVPGVGPIRREDWFQNVWRERRASFAAQKAGQQRALVFLGDSITQGWGDDFRGKFPGVKVANRGISGDTSRGLLARLDADVLTLNPQGIVLLIGTNDIGLGVPPEGIAANVKLLLTKIGSHNPNIPVIVCQVLPSSSEKERPADKIRQLNRLLAEAASGNKQVTVLDTYVLFANAAGDAKLEEFPDLLHPNEAGYAKLRAALWPLLATFGFVENESDSFTSEEGFEPLFDGHDLDGWGFRPTSAEDLASIKKWRASDPNMPPWPIVETPISFDDQTASSDGRFVAVNGRLVVTTPTEGRRIQQLYTTRDFPENFTLKLEFRATPNADSGVFLRGRQLQCRDYALAGPYSNLKKYKPQDWNELVVTVEGDTAHCTCNGEVLEAAYKLPNTGPIGLEGDRGQVEYRRIRLRHD